MGLFTYNISSIFYLYKMCATCAKKDSVDDLYPRCISLNKDAKYMLKKKKNI